MLNKQKSLIVVLVVALLFVGVPLVMAEDSLPPQQPQPPQPPPEQDVNINVDIPWGTIMVIAVVALLLFAVMGLAGGSGSTHTVERVERHHHDPL